MKNRFLCSILILLLLSTVSSAATVMPLKEFIETAVKNNPSYQIPAKDYLIALEKNKSARSLEDWNLISSAYWNESLPAATSGFAASYQRTVGYSLSAEKYIAGTGTAIQLKHNNSQINANYPSISIPGFGSIYPPTPYYLSSVSFTLSQPLLKNALGLAAKNALKLSGYSLKIAKIKLQEDWEEFIATVIDEYKEWQKAYLTVKIHKEKMKSVEGELALVKKQLRYGLSEELDVVQINQKEKAYKILLSQAEMNYEAQTKKIFGLINQAQKSALPENFVRLRATPPPDEGLDYLSKSSNIKRTADILVAIAKTNLENKENALLADVNLVLKATPNAYAQSSSNSLRSIGQYKDYSATISFSKALSNDKVAAEAKAARAEYDKALKTRENTLLGSRVGLSSLYSSRKYLNQMVELTEDNVKLARKRLELEQKKFRQGRSSVFFLLQAEDALLEAEQNYNDIIFAREKVVNQIKSLTDRYMYEYRDLLKTES